MKLLIIDINNSYLRLYRKELEEEGYDVMVAASGKDAIEKLERENPALVILECFLPEIDGLTLLGQIKERRPHTTVLLVTAYDHTAAFLGELKEKIKRCAGIRQEEEPGIAGEA